MQLYDIIKPVHLAATTQASLVFFFEINRLRHTMCMFYLKTFIYFITFVLLGQAGNMLHFHTSSAQMGEYLKSMFHSTRYTVNPGLLL